MARAYVLTVAGELDPHWAGALGAVLAHGPEGTTTLHAVVRDQAELHGVLARVRDLGVELVSVIRANESAPPLADPGVHLRTWARTSRGTGPDQHTSEGIRHDQRGRREA